MVVAGQQREMFVGHGAWEAVSLWEKQYMDRFQDRQKAVTDLSQFKLTNVALPGDVDAWKSVVLWGGLGWSQQWFDHADRNIRWLPPSMRFTLHDHLVLAVRSSGRRTRYYFATVCEWCNTVFLASRVDAVYCGSTHRQSARRAGYVVQ